LLIEADEAYDAAIAACMNIAGCEVHHVTNVALALPALDRNQFDVVVWGVPIPDPLSRHQSITELRLHYRGSTGTGCRWIRHGAGGSRSGR